MVVCLCYIDNDEASQAINSTVTTGDKNASRQNNAPIVVNTGAELSQASMGMLPMMVPGRHVGFQDPQVQQPNQQHFFQQGIQQQVQQQQVQNQHQQQQLQLQQQQKLQQQQHREQQLPNNIDPVTAAIEDKNQALIQIIKGNFETI